MDFSTIAADEATKAEASGGGSKFVSTPVEDGPALVRLREVIELGMVQEEYQGKPKKNLTAKMKVVFEVVYGANGSHAITKEDGEHVRNKEITLYLNKSYNERAKFRKLFDKMNYAGTVPVISGQCPSLHSFLGQPFMVDVRNNVSEKNGKTYTNIDNAAGEYTIRRAATPVNDPTTGIPTGEYVEVAVPEMSGLQRCFLWNSRVSDDVLRQMIDSITSGLTYEKNGIEYSRDFELNDIKDPTKNLAYEGSREQSLMDPAVGDLDAAIAETIDAPF